MPVLGDFEFVITGGGFSPGKPLTTTFKTGGRYGKALSYLLVELYSRKIGAESGTVELRINGQKWSEITVTESTWVHTVKVVRFSEASLFAQKENTFEAIGKNAVGGFGNVICHFHQST